MSTPEPAGYIVAGPDLTGRICADWDGEVHPTLEAGRKSLAECYADGWGDWSLYALIEVTR